MKDYVNLSILLAMSNVVLVSMAVYMGRNKDKTNGLLFITMLIVATAFQIMALHFA